MFFAKEIRQEFLMEQISARFAKHSFSPFTLGEPTAVAGFCDPTTVD